MFKALREARAGGYRAGVSGAEEPANPFRRPGGPINWLKRFLWEEARLEGLRERINAWLKGRGQ